jgi:PAS domain S-box-containing protein
MQALTDLSGLNDFIPRLARSPALLWLNGITDLLMAFSFYAIALMLAYVIRQRKDKSYSWPARMVAGGAAAWGTVHLLAAMTIWLPLYWLEGLLKGCTAVVSVAIAVLMARIIPQVLSLPGSAQLQAEMQRRKAAEQALHAANAALQNSTAQTQLLLDSTLDAVIGMDGSGTVLDWNTQAERIFGYPREQAIGGSLAELIVPAAYREQHRRGLLRFIDTGVPRIIGRRMEIAALRADASEFPIELTVCALAQDGNYLFNAFVRDISESKQAEAARQEALERLHKIAGQLPGVIFQFCLRPDGHACLPYVSDVLRDLYRVDPEEVKDDAAKVFAVVHPDDLAGHLASIQESARDLSPWRNEYRLRLADGTERWLFGNALPQREDDGAVVWHGYVTDITERKHMENALRESKFRWKFALEGSGDGLWDWDVANGTVFFSKLWKEMLGFDEHEVGDGLDEWSSRIHPDDKAATLAGVQDYFDGKVPVYITEYRMLCKDGSYKWILDRGLVVSRDAEGKPLRMIGTHTDISEHKQMEEKLRDSDAFNASVLNSLTSHIAVLDANGVIVAVNDAWRQFAKDNGLLEANQDIAEINYLDVCRKANNQPYGDGASEVEAGIAAVLAGERDAFHIEYPCHSPDQQRWFHMSVSPLHGSRRGVVVSHTNITERKRIEAGLIRSNAELEQFAYAVSHDMRQPLRMVSSYLSLIENALSGQLDEETQQFFDFAVNGAQRMDAMILSLLDYSRVGRKFEAKTLLGSRESLDEALAFLNPELTACGGEIKVTGDWPELLASGDELTRLLQNLIGNALKYHKDNQPPQVHVHGAICAGSFRVEVRDQGIGIDPSQMNRLFKVFSRLQARSRFDGTGVGLALCRKIVEHHGGCIGVESAGEGQGSTFWFELPVVNAPSPA